MSESLLVSESRLGSRSRCRSETLLAFPLELPKKCWLECSLATPLVSTMEFV